METVLDSEWRKATYSGTSGNGCVEAATSADRVLVRDTTDRAGGTLAVPANAWRAFTAELKSDLASPGPNASSELRSSDGAFRMVIRAW